MSIKWKISLGILFIILLCYFLAWFFVPIREISFKSPIRAALAESYAPSSTTAVIAANAQSQRFTGDIPTYIKQKAKEMGVNPETALFIAKKESNFDPSRIGDHGISFGLWQFNLQANPDIDVSCALDAQCSTNLAMKWILEGKVNSWTTWHYRCKWYADAPNC